MDFFNLKLYWKEIKEISCWASVGCKFKEKQSGGRKETDLFGDIGGVDNNERG